MDLTAYYPKDEVPPEILAMLQLTGDNISLESMWALMDLAWTTTNAKIDDQQSLAAFYAHPVWILNGFFTETHKESVDNREAFSDYIAAHQPKRIADYGGGFGALARKIAVKSPGTSIEIIEPFPSDLAISLTKKYKTISFVQELTGQYDFIVALDVLEHVPAPLELVYLLATHCKPNGFLLLANCFYPVIKCHLPCTFYLRESFDFLLSQMGLQIKDNVLYGKVYTLTSAPLVRPEKLKFWIELAKFHFLLKNSLRPLWHSLKALKRPSGENSSH